MAASTGRAAKESRHGLPYMHFSLDTHACMYYRCLMQPDNIMPQGADEQDVQGAGVVEDEVRVAVIIPRTLDRGMELECARRDITKRQFVTEAVDAYLKSRRPA